MDYDELISDCVCLEAKCKKLKAKCAEQEKEISGLRASVDRKENCITTLHDLSMGQHKQIESLEGLVNEYRDLFRVIKECRSSWTLSSPAHNED